MKRKKPLPAQRTRLLPPRCSSLFSQLIMSRIIPSISVCCFTYAALWAVHESEMKSVPLS